MVVITKNELMKLGYGKYQSERSKRPIEQYLYVK